MHSPPVTIGQVQSQVQALGLDRLDTQMLLLHVLGRTPHDRAWLLAHDSDAMNAASAMRLDALVQRRLAGEPVAYLTGSKEFYGLHLNVDARVLAPRPDTETLVDWTLEVLDEPNAPLRVIDLGTGSGAIALALQYNRPAWQVSAVDLHPEALAVARVNAQHLGLNVQFAQGAWLAGVQGTFHAIVSNPPYIPVHDPHLAALTHEPLSALVSGTDGLDDLRTIILQAPPHLQPGGWLLLEHGYDQARAVRALLTAAGMQAVQSRCDLAGIERCSGGQMPPLQFAPGENRT